MSRFSSNSFEYCGLKFLVEKETLFDKCFKKLAFSSIKMSVIVTKLATIHYRSRKQPHRDKHMLGCFNLSAPAS